MQVVVDARIKRPCETSWINVEFRRIYMAEWCGNRLCVLYHFWRFCSHYIFYKYRIHLPYICVCIVQKIRRRRSHVSLWGDNELIRIVYVLDELTVSVQLRVCSVLWSLTHTWMVLVKGIRVQNTCIGARVILDWFDRVRNKLVVTMEIVLQLVFANAQYLTM